MTRKSEKQVENYWEGMANKNLLGKKIVSVRYLSKREMEAMGWFKRSVVIQLDDGSIFFPSSDDEGNDAGALFGHNKAGESITFPVI